RRVTGYRRAQWHIECANVDSKRVRHFSALQHGVVFAGERQRVTKWVRTAGTQVLRSRAHTCVEEASVKERRQVVSHRNTVDAPTGQEPQTAGCVRQFRSSMAFNALALASENTHASDLLGIQCLTITVQVVIQRRLIRDQGGFVHLDREPEEEWEIGLHLAIRRAAQRNLLSRVPQPWLEDLLDHVTVGGSVCAGESAQYRIGWGDLLLGEQLPVEHASADVREGAPAAGHFDCAAGRSYGLRGGRGIVEC